MIMAYVLLLSLTSTQARTIMVSSLGATPAIVSAFFPTNNVVVVWARFAIKD